jgi:fumarate hydratase subunit alpha
MRELHISKIIDAVEKLCINANYYLNDDILDAIKNGMLNEESETGKTILKEICENVDTASCKQMAMCQDTGMAVIFLDIGQQLQIVGGDLTEAVNEGVRRGYRNGYLRKSVVKDPFDRVNTDDNTPAIIHYNIVPGDKLKVIVAPKGFGSENMSALKMLKPSDGIEGVKKFIIDVVDAAGPNPCPPIVVGVGVGGTMEKAAILAKRALVRPINKENPDPRIAQLEEEILTEINKLGIGPAGLGGRLTALGVNIETFATHIAGLPVAVNISCHVTRHAERVL